MTNYNEITIAELNTSSFSETEKNSEFIFSYSDIMPEPVEDGGIRIFAEADKNTFLQLAEKALANSEYEECTDTLYVSEQLTVDCRQDRDYVISVNMAMYFGTSPEEVKDNLKTDNGESVPLAFEEQDKVFEFVVDYTENVLNKNIDEMIAEQNSEIDLENDYER